MVKAVQRVNHESLIEKQIREALERGAFDDLPGAGKPIPGIDGPHDELWWVKDKMRRENVSYVPPSVLLRREIDGLDDRVSAERSERAVRELVEDLNARITAAIRNPPDGPTVRVHLVDLDEVLAAWRAARRR